MNETLEHTARQIAERGRDELLARLRTAFKEAASAHSDVLDLDDEQLEQMVQRAADRADGLQWRRALAGVATEELGISLGEALGHPAVARAQAIVGGPSYEDSLAALGPAPATAADPETGVNDTDVQRSPEQIQAAAPSDEEAQLEPVGDEEVPATAQTVAEPPQDATAPGDTSDPAGPAAGARAAEPVAAVAAAEPEDADQTLRLAAVHLGGIANLEPSEQGIALLLSADGVDIARGSEELLGRLRWPEIRSLEVPPARGMRRRRRGGGAHLVIRTRHGDATFEIPETSTEELQTQLEPLLQRHLPH